MADYAGPPDAIQRLVPEGAVMRFYDQAGRLILERVLSHTRGTDWHRPAEAAAAIDDGLASLFVLVYDGETGERTPMAFGLVCRLSPTLAS